MCEESYIWDNIHNDKTMFYFEVCQNNKVFSCLVI